MILGLIVMFLLLGSILLSHDIAIYHKIFYILIVFSAALGLYSYNEWKSQKKVEKQRARKIVSYNEETINYDTGVLFRKGTRARNYYRSWRIGDWKEYSENGQLVFSENYDSLGQLNYRKAFYFNGKIKSQYESFPDAEIENKFDSMGNKIYEISYKEVVVDEYDETVVVEKYFNNNNLIREEEYYEDDKDEVTIKLFFKNGRLKRHFKLDGDEYKWIKIYDSDGELILNKN